MVLSTEHCTLGLPSVSPGATFPSGFTKLLELQCVPHWKKKNCPLISCVPHLSPGPWAGAAWRTSKQLIQITLNISLPPPGPHEPTLSLLFQPKKQNFYEYSFRQIYVLCVTGVIFPVSIQVWPGPHCYPSIREVVCFAELITTRELRVWWWLEPPASVDNQHEDYFHKGKKNYSVRSY